MSFNIFGSNLSPNVRLGYISPDDGFVQGITICDANEYAKLNPGVRFILRTKDYIKFLSINEVNRLTENDVLTSEVNCGGINFNKSCEPPKVYFYGSGVGAKANPIIGSDGSILAIDLVSGGFGYRYPPIIEIKDSCGIGAGVYVKAVLGQLSESYEVYDDINDFEEYLLCEEGDENYRSYGQKYDKDGKPLGIWDPTIYANLNSDPIRREIEKYQDFLERLTNPWWSTRKSNPISVVSQTKKTRNVFNVTFDTWTSFMNSYAISPVPPSNVLGSDYAGILFSMEWEEVFPYSGEYTFNGSCDNVSQLYLDGNKIGDLGGFSNSPAVFKKTITEGSHRIKIDLLNIPLDGNAQAESSKVIFDTSSYLGKATKSLWKINPTSGKDSDFLNAFGITPFQPKPSSIKTKDYAGEHIIRWENIKFPKSGNYTFEIMSDHSAKIYIGNSSRQGDVAIGNGLRSIDKGGDELILMSKGTNESGNIKGKKIVTEYVKKGKYRIRVELEQVSGKRNDQGNPMAFAMRITSGGYVDFFTSGDPWTSNPMGVALTIDAPIPPIPQEPIPPQEGRCPRNPIWSTRYPNASQQWYPVNFDSDRWSKFMNRYAISPIPPLSLSGTDGGGVTYTNTWNINLPYSGYYGVKGCVDNFGRVLIDGREVSSLSGFKDETPDTAKIYLTQGNHKITVDVRNEKTEQFTVVDKVIFSTKDWKSGARVIGDVTCTGIRLIPYTHDDWSDFMNEYSVSPRKKPLRGRVNMIWNNVDFPEDGSYEIITQADNIARIRIDGVLVNTITEFVGEPQKSFLNISRGKKKIEIELKNVYSGAKKWKDNPAGAALLIKKKVTVSTGTSKSWTLNPIGIAAILIPPPCPKLIGGRGVVTDIIIEDPGNGFFPIATSPTLSPPEPPQVLFTLVDFEIEDPGIDYKPTDPIIVDPNNGAVLIPEYNPDGSLRKIVIKDPGDEFDSTPSFNIDTTTGRGVSIKPKVKIVKYPLQTTPGDRGQYTDIPSEEPESERIRLGQVIDLPGEEVVGYELKTQAEEFLDNRDRISGDDIDVVIDDDIATEPEETLPIVYPVTLILKDIYIENPGINYSEDDEIIMEPSNGAVLQPVYGNFGKLQKVDIINPGQGFTSYPNIYIKSRTGVNAVLKPQFKVIRDPIDVDQAKLIQVTDLVGLKKTGYIDGRPYYGSVFYKDDIKYAGVYETSGELIQVYDTLKESIDKKVTTKPSAVIRQGTDTNSNNPRLNIPGTPENLI